MVFHTVPWGNFISFISQPSYQSITWVELLDSDDMMNLQLWIFLQFIIVTDRYTDRLEPVRLTVPYKYND